MATQTSTWARPRTYRNLAIGFGLVNVEISIGPLFDDGSVEGKFVCPEHKEPVEQRWYCPKGDHIIDKGEGKDSRYSPMHGYPYGEKIVVPEPGELQELAELVDHEMTIERIVPVDTIDPAYYTNTYLVWPVNSPRNEAAFGILATAMRTDKRAAVGRVALNASQKMLVLRWSTHFGCMLAHICAFDENVRWGNINLIVEGASHTTAPTRAELAAARPLIAALDGDFDPTLIRDTHKQRLVALIARLGKGKPAAKKKGTKKKPVENKDLLDALRASVAEQAETREKAKA